MAAGERPAQVKRHEGAIPDPPLAAGTRTSTYSSGCPDTMPMLSMMGAAGLPAGDGKGAALLGAHAATQSGCSGNAANHSSRSMDLEVRQPAASLTAWPAGGEELRSRDRMRWVDEWKATARSQAAPRVVAYQLPIRQRAACPGTCKRTGLPTHHGGIGLH